MAYMKFKELTKYFDFKTEVLDSSLLPEYTIEYLTQTENTLLAYKNSKDYILFTNKKMVLFDRDPLAAYYKKIHIVPYKSISTGAINYMPCSKVKSIIFQRDNSTMRSFRVYRRNKMFFHLPTFLPQIFSNTLW